VNHTLVVFPRHAENDHALRLDHPVKDALFFEDRPGGHHGFQGLQNLLHGLQELGFVGVALANALKDGVDVVHCASPDLRVSTVLSPALQVVLSIEQKACHPNIQALLAGI